MAASSKNSKLCSTLESQLPGQVSYPKDAPYDASINSYFYQQARLAPQCIVFPKSASDVSRIVKTIAGMRAKAAVRGGGHTPIANVANIDNAITIDLSDMNAVSLDPAYALDLPSTKNDSGSSPGLPSSSAASTTPFVPNSASFGEGGPLSTPNILSAGGGATWGDVYQKLDSTGLISIGGRGTSLGVGGLTTGGGISFYLGQRGFACDNVVNMEVVLADGSIVNANTLQRPDLFRALKGGSNNFGIVTRFDLKTYSQGQLWGGFIAYPGSTVPQQLSAFERFMQLAKSDSNAEIICAIGYVGAYKSVIVSVGLHYTKPVANPSIFQPFTAIQPQLSNSIRIGENIDFVNEVESKQARNSRGMNVNTVFIPTAAIIEKVYQLWSSTTDSIKTIPGIAYFLIFQRMPVTKPGNALGLESSDDPLVLCLLSITWTQAHDDATINSVAQTLIEKIDQATKAAGLFNGFKYLNYAGHFQDPIGSYGPASKAQLQAVSKKYDPEGFFQAGVSGGFKLF
ncbi:MAG: hypothetical protein Q9217_006252, partial [Psora testacea]